MRNKFTAYLSGIIIIVFILYIVYDTIAPAPQATVQDKDDGSSGIADSWKSTESIYIASGNLKAVAVSGEGDIILAGDSFVACYNATLKPVWNIGIPNPATSVSISTDTIFVSTQETVIVIDMKGIIIDEWGPYEDNCIITSVNANRSFIAFADAGNKLVFILRKTGELYSVIGHTGTRFIIPSPYFDVALTDDNKIIVANTGERRVETRNLEGELISHFGEPGVDPARFCGCCNPAHFALMPDGIVTSEKGINRIKILTWNGEFVEFVSSKNSFVASIPLDIAVYNDKFIYAANPYDSKLYIYTNSEDNEER